MTTSYLSFRADCSFVFRACLENRIWVAQATRLCRPATRRTKCEQRFEPIRTVFSQRSCRHSCRRVADRGGRVARATHFRKGSWPLRRNDPLIKQERPPVFHPLPLIVLLLVVETRKVLPP